MDDRDNSDRGRNRAVFRLGLGATLTHAWRRLGLLRHPQTRIDLSREGAGLWYLAPQVRNFRGRQHVAHNEVAGRTGERVASHGVQFGLQSEPTRAHDVAVSLGCSRGRADMSCFFLVPGAAHTPNVQSATFVLSFAIRVKTASAQGFYLE